MRKLPLGKQNFRDIRENNLLYVDKTRQIYNLVTTGSLYFLSRPRRFGKSLLISKLRYLFEGKKELFQDLYIGKQTDYAFEEYPVLQFNFAKLGHKVENLEEKMQRLILGYASEYGLILNSTSLSENFTELVKGIAKQGKPVVLLVDEYDKPIIDFFTEYEKAKVNQEVLQSFFSPLKDLDSQGHLHFLFITGVSKFSRVSLFSDLNNLTDLSKAPVANDLLGITQEELERDFKEHINFGATHFNISKEVFLKAIKDWYNGYSYDGKVTLYNPFSILTFFTHYVFDNYWFETGTPTFLVESIREQYVNPKELEYIKVDNYFFNSFSLEHLDIVGLLYQTGYLTIKEATFSMSGSKYVLGYPNIEVRHSMIYNLTQAYTYKTKSIISQAMVRMQEGLQEGDIDIFIEQLKIILSDISYHLHPSNKGRQKKNKNKENKEDVLFRMWEGYFQTIIYLITSYMDMTVQTEVTKHKGRLDLIAQTNDFIYLMEFKLNEKAENAIEQIRNREYAAVYRNTTKKVFLVGVNFSKEERNVEDWDWEIWE
ncbi:MAG: ATP-binding protein [Saprospiraceae bacterium]|nr:ATP-binding protein [Saprospiraceae bacterium]